ncbi:threonine/serine exporter [Cohnella sp. AR92]|nr:threonine/serine exporter family protein [Cohnella sp. AR92]RUS49227.1 threonine/serine exporter [Cohnella sp. AR92]
MLAGQIMMENGAETYRVEDTMTRIADSFGLPRSQSFVTPTGIIFSIEGSAPDTRLTRISERSTDLRKVIEVNAISRRISAGELDPQEALVLLQGIEKSNPGLSAGVKTAVAAISSGCFLIMFKGEWGDFLPALVTGGLGYAAVTSLHRFLSIKLFSEFMASVVVGILACIFVASGMAHNLNTLIIGSVMPLVPGLLITNAVRDLMAGHYVSGLSKGAEAFLTALAIGTGIAVVLSFYRGEGLTL